MVRLIANAVTTTAVQLLRQEERSWGDDRAVTAARIMIDGPTVVDGGRALQAAWAPP